MTDRHEPREGATSVLERLQKIISRAGVASRRGAETLIVSGQVEVNGRVVTELGTKADPERDSIRVAGRRLKPPPRPVFLALNKPASCVSTLSDPAGRSTLRDCLAGVSGRVFPVGRLEYHATGLVLLTSDGDFAARLFRALGRGFPQTYHIKVKSALTSDELLTVAQRVGTLRAVRTGPNPWYEACLPGARQDRMRKTLAELGHPVEKLKRVALGRVELGDLDPGRWRPLTEHELHTLEQDAARTMKASGVAMPGRPAPASQSGRNRKPRRTRPSRAKRQGR